MSEHHPSLHDLCEHNNSLRYARKILPNNTIQICVQCAVCLDAVKTARHGGRLFIKPHEIPRGAIIFDWIDQAEWVQFDDN